MSWYRAPSLYSQKFRRLGAGIFNEFRAPVMSHEIKTGAEEEARKDFMYKFVTNQNIIERQSRMPNDLCTIWNPNWYPPHPHVRQFVHVLRQYGLFRDEHKDFIEEMKRLRKLRGKVYRERGSKGGKKARLRAMEGK